MTGSTRSHFLGLLFCAVLTGCSVSIDSGPAHPIELSMGGKAGLPKFDLVSQDDKAIVYRIDNSPASVFVSALKSCTVEEGEKLPAVTRKLFVGLDHFLVRSRDQKTFGSYELFTMTCTAKLDDSPLQLAVVSSIHEGCATDVALWTSQSDSTAGLALVGRLRDQILDVLSQPDGRALRELCE